jgi:hypothetical protein
MKGPSRTKQEVLETWAVREAGLVIAAILIDNARGDERLTELECLGYETTDQPVVNASHAIRAIVDDEKDPYVIFAPAVAAYRRMKETGEVLAWRRFKTCGKPGRNSPCPCGSGKKFKRCCAPALDEKE